MRSGSNRRRPAGTAMLNSALAATTFTEFLIAVAIDAGLATLIFRHAYRRQNRHATAWGVFTFLAAGLAIPLYFITYWIRTRRANRG